MARAEYYTLLSLDRYAKLMGINPLHFAGASAGQYFPLRNRCSDIWVQDSWQFADTVSRNDLAQTIAIAERDIARELGWWPAPVWTAQEQHQFPRHYRKNVYRRYAQNVRGQRVSVKTEFGKVIAAGRRAVTAVEEGTTVTYSDDDGDGFAEIATVTAATTLTDVFEIHVFTAGKSGGQTWEIRPPISKSISGGVVTLKFYSWQMIDPVKWEFMPTTDIIDGDLAIDLSGLTETPIDTTNLVTTVDVYRVYNDTVSVSAQFFWEPEPSNAILTATGFCSSNSGDCEACALTTQDGCSHVRDALRGIVVPTPATYDSDEGAWDQNAFTECREPDFVKLWYYSGHYNREWLSGQSYDPLSLRWAKAIAYLATARLERPLCQCGNLTALASKMQTDVAIANREATYQINPIDMSNPFGTRYGEIMAWREVNREPHTRMRGGGTA